MSETFNYISFGNRDFVEQPVDVLEMSRSRMFEYTPPDLSTALEALSADTIAFLEKLPTFLCSEVFGEHDSISMIVKFGRISAVTAASREVCARFETLIDFGALNFRTLEAARGVFGADDYQLYRTHWAVRLGDAQAILARLREFKPALPPRDPMMDALGIDPKALPPPQPKKPIGVAESVEEFLRLLYGWPAKAETETFFRGHDDATYQLTPSLLRKWPNGDPQYLTSEDKLCKELLIAHHDEFQGDQYCFDRLVRMQHYGLPTRLLDISGNPLVALFFACHSEPKNKGKDGEVVMFRVPSDSLKYYDSDTVSCLANLSNLTYAQKNLIDLRLEQDTLNRSEPILKLLHHIKSEKAFFESRIKPEDLGSIVCVKAKRTNTRIKSQSGAFLLFGHEATLDEAGQAGVEIARITVRNKSEILAQLDRLNINATTVYPSIEQTAVHIREERRSPEPKPAG